MLVEMPKYAGMIKNRTLPQISEFVRVVAERGYDPAVVGAIVELESAKTWSPAIAGAPAFTEAPGYAVGLIQFAPSTCRKLGSSTLAMKRMTFPAQVPYVPKYYDLFGGPTYFKRPVQLLYRGLWGGDGPRTRPCPGAEGRASL